MIADKIRNSGNTLVQNVISYSAYSDDLEDYMEMTQTAGDRKTFTFSFWLKYVLGSEELFYLFETREDSSINRSSIYLIDRPGLQQRTLNFFSEDNDTGGTDQLGTGDFTFSSGGWNHVVVRVDTTQSTADDRFRIYVDNNLLPTNVTIGSQNDNTQVGVNGHTLRILARVLGGGSGAIDRYIADFIFLDGESASPSSFGESSGGRWVPKAYSGSYPGNSYHLDFSNASDLGEDSSGNSIDFTNSGLTRSTDVPSN